MEKKGDDWKHKDQEKKEEIQKKRRKGKKTEGDETAEDGNWAKEWRERKKEGRKWETRRHGT